jgi:hypothetical protein
MYVLAGALCLAGFCGPLRAADAASAAPGAAADYSSPDKTWATVCAALKNQDLDAFRACFHTSSELSRLFMAAYSDTTVTTFRLATAIELIPGGKASSERLKGVYTDLVLSGLNRTTEITGSLQNEAKWSRVVKTDKGEDRTEIMYFKQVNDKWLIDTERSYLLDTSEGRKAAEDFLDSSKKQLPLLKKIITDIQANRVRSLDELRRRLSE